jgi:glutathione S-transferase
MKIYNSMGPNPKVVRMFAAEKGLDIPMQEIDLMGAENRRPPYSEKVNVAGQIPALELDDGTMLTEVTAICEYLDEVGDGASLIGETPQERAETRMWTRRADLNVCEPMGNGFRWSDGLQLFQERMICLPDAADGMKSIAQDRLKWLDGLMAGRQFMAGDRFTMADVLLFSFLDFFAGFGQPLDPELKNINAWFDRVKARPTAEV